MTPPSSPSPWITRNALWLTLGASAILLLVAARWGVGNALVWTFIVLLIAGSVGQVLYLQWWKRRKLAELEDP